VEVVAGVHSNPLVLKFDRLFPLTTEEKAILEGACARIATFATDQDIVRDGDRPSECNLLLEGFVCRYKVTANGRRQILSFQFPGDIFDTQSFILEEMDHSIAALTLCRVGVIPHTTMRTITEKYPRLARALWKETLMDAAVFREWVVSVGRRSAYERIAHLMCEVFARLEVVRLTRGNAVDWPMTQTEIGDALGLSPVHVNRTLQALRGDGLITLRNSTLVIRDWERLKEVGQFDRRYLHLKPPTGPASGGIEPRMQV
jgi:CRP-like cAMP-binding protein